VISTCPATTIDIGLVVVALS